MTYAEITELPISQYSSILGYALTERLSPKGIIHVVS